MGSVDTYYFTALVWELLASFTNDFDDLRSLRLVCRGAHEVIKNPPTLAAQSILRYIRTDKTKYTLSLDTLDSYDSIQIQFDADNRKPWEHRAKKLVFWHSNLRMLAIHRYVGDESEYFGKMTWAELVPNKKNLQLVSRVLNDVHRVSDFSRWLVKFPVGNWLTIDWSCRV